jgi:uncharacterized protein YjbI with pentapeptide repeats
MTLTTRIDAILTDASLRGADLVGAELRGATIEGAEFTDADFSNADLSGTVGTPFNEDVATWNNTTCPDITDSDDHDDTCVGHFLQLT